jgi:hypothetical protein
MKNLKMIVVLLLSVSTVSCTSFKLYNSDPAGFTDIEACQAVGYAMAAGDKGRAMRVIQEIKRRESNHTLTVSAEQCKTELEITQADTLQTQATLGAVANQLNYQQAQNAANQAAQMQQMNQINQANALSDINSNLSQMRMNQQMQDFREANERNLAKYGY